jgi:methyl-accepting chemotaxis protein
VDAQSLFLGLLAGASAGATLTWWWLGPERRRVLAHADELETELTRLRRELAEVSSATAELFDAAARRIEQSARSAERSMRNRGTADEALWTDLEPLGEGTLDADKVDRVAGKAESEVAHISTGVRDLVAEAGGLERATAFIVEMTSAMDKEQRDRQDVEALAYAAGETIAAAAAMDDAVRRVRDSAGETANLSAKVATEAERGYRAVHRTLDEIERIREVTDTARKRILDLGERVDGIGDVVRVIQEITERTGLLALNASIIAAQAGQHGRSFAVVAREIKALAQRTAASTKEISEAIRSVQEESERATAAMENGAKAVAEGFQVAIAAGDALGTIRESSRRAQKRVQAMTRAFNQQTAATRQVVDLAGRVSERATAFAVAARNSQTPERLSAAAGELQASAARIAELITQQKSAASGCSDAFGALLAEVVNLAKVERDLRRRLEGLRRGAASAREAGSDLASQLSLVREATVQLRTEIGRLQAAG